MAILPSTAKTVLLLLCLILGACAARQPGMIRDLEVLPQDAAQYVSHPDSLLISPEAQDRFYHDFLDRFYRPWHRDNPRFSGHEVFWGLRSYASRDLFGPNNLPLPRTWIQEMERRADQDGYPSTHQPGITVVHASMRVLPTSRPVFFDPSRPGQGFPFDYMQNTLVPAGTPVLITHVSRDQQWALAETDFAAGWIRWHELALVDADFISSYQSGSLAGFTADDIPMLSSNGSFLVSGRVGMALPLAPDQPCPDSFQVLVPVRHHTGSARIIPASVPRHALHRMPFKPTQANFSRIANAMMGQAYGWGGLYENRDCSALLKDFLAGFGLFLPRNSRGQAEAGQVIELDGLDPAQKKELIAEQGQPWLTILYMPGHVMLYIGQDRETGRIAAYHSMWGLRTWRPFRDPGRWVIGRTVITSLEPGQEMFFLIRPQGLLVERLTRMVLVAEPS
ncbi:NlpC/P60 family N-terminal domain-containing protein [Desulfonatronovibrio hydrogenovorans]|uniref:NlpC/P60 family N-terminal domain-containing protein n=1 Tax=Desulfonatronovibrio hydrogenovorans TaxID=53245 RepID=UPI00137665CF|nr:NlpC/P60 family N-terminal domain-containing protein [Desulfonatronovibrio hydrogenovorans]